MPPVCTSPSANMEDFSFSIDTEYGSISFQFKDGGFSLFFRDGFRLQDCWDDNPLKPSEEASPPPEIKECFPPLSFEGTSPPQKKAKLDELPLKASCYLQDYWTDSPPTPIEGASSPPEIKECFPPLNFEKTDPPQKKAKLDELPLKATCNLPKHTGRSASIMKRCNFPKKTTGILKEWLSQHKDNPYPSEEVKSRLAGATNLSLKQVNDWMINARRRYLKNKKKYFGAK